MSQGALNKSLYNRSTKRPQLVDGFTLAVGIGMRVVVHREIDVAIPTIHRIVGLT